MKYGDAQNNVRLKTTPWNVDTSVTPVGKVNEFYKENNFNNIKAK